MDRLLTEKEMHEAEQPFPEEAWATLDVAKLYCFFQDAKTLRAVGEWLDIESIINMLKQSERLMWQKKGRNICREQIKRLEALERGEMLDETENL